jgi:hypothetical protein
MVCGTSVRSSSHQARRRMSASAGGGPGDGPGDGATGGAA